MKFFAHISFVIVSAFVSASAFASQDKAADSVITAEAPVFVKDTLLDLNKQLKGVKEVVFPKGTLVPEALEIDKQGVIVLKSEDLLKADKYNFELKATSTSDEVYIVEVTIQKEGGKYLVTTICDKIDMATGFRAEGKIYIVVTVSLILFSVIIIYLITMDRKIKKLNARLASQKTN